MKLKDYLVYLLLVCAVMVLLMTSTSIQEQGNVWPATLNFAEEMGINEERGNQLGLALLVGDIDLNMSPPDGSGFEVREPVCRKERYSWQQICVWGWGRAWGG